MKISSVGIEIKKKHRANAIVNSENAGMGWSGGIPGAICGALGAEASNVDQQRKGLMKKFNDLINQSEGDSGENKTPNSGNSSDSNNSDEKKDKKSPTPNISNSVKAYFRENNVKSIELDGENWIITYKDKNEKKSLQKSDVPKLQGLEDYLKSQGIKILTDEQLASSSLSINSSANKNNNGTKYWPWILGIGGILVIGIVAWAVSKKSKKRK